MAGDTLRRVQLIKFVGINFKESVHLKGKDGGNLEAAWRRQIRCTPSSSLSPELSGGKTQVNKFSTLEFCLECSISKKWPVSFRTRKENQCSEKKLLKKRGWLLINHMFQRVQWKGIGGWRLLTDWVTLGSASLACNPHRESI